MKPGEFCVLVSQARAIQSFIKVSKSTKSNLAEEKQDCAEKGQD